MKQYDPVQLRWMRRYAGRRWIMGVPVYSQPVGAMVDDMLALGIAQRRVWHALRPEVWSVHRFMTSHLTRFCHLR